MATPINADKLIKLMAMTTSSHDGEALNAIRMANAIVYGAGRTWEDVLRGKAGSGPGAEAMKAHAETRRQGRSNVGDEFLDRAFELLFSKTQSGSFLDFLKSVYNYYEINGYLTPNQRESIVKAYENAR